MKAQPLQLLAISAAFVAMGVVTPQSRLDAPSTSLARHGAPAQDTTVSFARDIMPIIERTCQRCHGGVGEDGEVVIEEGLNMTTYEGLMAGSTYGLVIEPGNPDESYLVELIVDGDMPKEGDPLTAEEIAKITQWVAAGALNN